MCRIFACGNWRLVKWRRPIGRGDSFWWFPSSRWSFSHYIENHQNCLLYLEHVFPRFRINQLRYPISIHSIFSFTIRFSAFRNFHRTDMIHRSFSSWCRSFVPYRQFLDEFPNYPPYEYGCFIQTISHQHNCVLFIKSYLIRH